MFHRHPPSSGPFRFLVHPPSGPLVALALLTLLAAPDRSWSQDSADEVLATAREEYRERVEGVENYTLIQEVNGSEQILYFERRVDDGHVQFVPVGPFKLLMVSGALDDTRLGAMAPSGGVLEGVRDALVQSATTAGMQELKEAVLQSADGPLADFLGPLLTPADPGAAGDPKAMLAALTDPEHLKDALLEGAKRAAMNQAKEALLNAAAGQLSGLLEALQGQAGPGQLLGELGSMIANGELPTPGDLGIPGAGGGPGPAAGPSLAQRGASGALNAGLAALGGVVAGAMTAGAMEAMDEAATMRPLQLDAFELLRQMEGHARITNTEEVDGHETWVMAVEDFEEIEEAETEDFRSGTLTLWLDRELYLPRRLLLEGEAKVEGDWVPVSLESRHDDYREVDGMIVPFASVTRFSGMGSSISDEERAEMKKKMEEMEEQLAELPPERRAMVERMMKQRMPQLEAMLGEEGQSLETVVTEVRVNEGPPEELLEEARQMMQNVPRPGG